jgi:D-inositol-3-phosphate glycosyltransferase
VLRERNAPGASNTEVALIGGADEDHMADWNAEQRRLHGLREELGLRDTVHFLGAQAQDRLPHYYAAADVVVVPSHYESFGMVALEAQACGTPVVASRVGGLPAVVDDGVSGLLVPHDDPDALAASLEHLLSDEALRVQMGCNARRHALSYSWGSVCRANRRVYDEVVTHHIEQQAASA